MPTPTQQQPPEAVNVQRYWEALRRHRLLFAIPLLVGWLVVWGASWLIPPRYKSSTLILVEQPTMPKDYVLPNVADNLQVRLQSITQQILSRSRLLHIVDEMNLYSKDRAQLSPDDLVERMRKNIDIELVRGSDNRINAFNVYYTADNPQVAQGVTSKLTSLFINENLEVRQQESEGNTKFLTDQLQSARQTLEVQENKVREFKALHPGELPGQLNSNVQILGGLQTQLQAAVEALSASKQQRVYLETLLAQYRALRGPSNEPGGPKGSVAELDEQIDKLRTELRDLSATYGDQYPEIRRLKDQISRAELQRKQLLEDLRSKDDRSQPDTQISDAALAGVKDSGALPQVQSQLKANQIEIKNREQSIAALTAQINEYQARLNREPIREQELADLTRGYDQSKASYDDLLKKKNDSAIATSMERLQQGEHFRVIDPPSLPLKPSFPNRLKFCGLGVLFGLMLGAGCVWSAEVLDDRLYSEGDLRKLLPVSVLSEIPTIYDPADEERNHRGNWIGWATTAVVAAAILAGSAVSYLKG
jgi:polysaccharide chain length determinant protein (PEP-CTERM system associated)